MAEDQNKPGHPDRCWGDDDDLRNLFRASAPSVRRVDVEALLSAAQARRSNRLRLAWSQWIGRARELFSRTANPLPWRRTMLATLKIAAAALMTAGGLFYLAVAPSMEATA